MTLNYVTLTGSFPAAIGLPYPGAQAVFTPSGWLTDSGDHDTFPPVPVTAVIEPRLGQLVTGTGGPVSLLATDSSGPVPSGWQWSVTISGFPATAPHAFSFFLAYTNGSTQDFSALVPVSPVTTMAAYMPLPNGIPLAGQVPLSDGSSQGFSTWATSLISPMTTLGDMISGGTSGAVARVPGNTATTREFLRSAGNGSTATAPAWDTLQASDVPAATSGARGAVQLAGDIGGTATSPQVTGTHLGSPLPVAQGGTGSATAAAAITALTGAQSAGEYLRSDGTHAALAAIQAGDVPTLNQDTTGTAANVSGTVAIAHGGTGQTGQAAALTALTGAQTSGRYVRSDGTNAALAAIQAADVPTLNQSTTGTAANITGVAAIANGGTGASSQQAAITALTGTQGAGKYLRSDGTNSALATIQAADVPVLNQNTTGTAASVTATLDQLPHPAADVSLNSHKITSLANGVASSDAAAFGQIPTALPPNGSAGGDLGSTYPSPQVVATHLSSPLPIAQGGTAAASAAAAYNALSPMTTIGDTEYESGAGTASRLAGNTSATKNFLTQTGNGTISAAPAWGTIAAADMPTGTTSTKGALRLDGTAADINLSGVQSAGSTGLSADAGHIHPHQLWLPGDNGFLTATGDPVLNQNTLILTKGTVYLMKLPIRYAFTITNLWFWVATAGSGASGGNFAGLFGSDGTLLTSCSDLGTTFNSIGAQQVALTTAQPLSANTFVWAAIVMNAANTQPTLRRAVGPETNNTTIANIGLTAATYRYATNGTLQTSLSSIVPASNSQTNAAAFWVGAS